MASVLVVYLFYFGAHAYRTATFTVVVFGYIDTASRLEVGVQLEFFVVQIADGSVAQFIEVVWQYLGRQAYGNTFHTLCKQQWEFYR